MGILRSILGLTDIPKKGTASADPAQQSEKIPPESISEALRPFKAFIDGMLDNLSIERIEELTLREAITRFVDGKPKSVELAKGALIVQPHREGKLVLWAFLHSDNTPMCGDDGKPFGRKAICARLDDELTTTLKGKELLIVE